MAKLVVITDLEDRVLGSVRADPIKTDQGTLVFQKLEDPNVKYHDLDVADDVLEHPPERLLAHLGEELKRRRSAS